MEYLKDRQYYIDRYDLITVRQCLELIDVHRVAYAKTIQDKNLKIPMGDMAHTANLFTNQQLFFAKAARYGKKDETIQRWILEDQIKQEKHDKTPEPQRVRCPDCKKSMHCRLKHLETLEDPLRMMFLFECKSCKKKHWIYEDGSERESTPTLCPKCKAEVDMSVIKEGKDQITWKTTCMSCGFNETTVDDLAKGRAERQKREEEDKKLLEECRREFCSEEKGKEAFEYVESLKVAKVVYEEELKKYDSLAFQKVSQVKKLSIIDLEKLLSGLLSKEEFIKLSLGQPQIAQHVIVPFSVQDANAARKKDMSVSDIQKLINDALEGTNWRLMTDGVDYRLGFLSGRLKGYEREEDFFELAGQKVEEESSKIYHETMMKYAGSSAVQLAKLSGEWEGVDNTRKKRLEREPEGFFLNESDGPYNCGLCDERHDKVWLNPKGIYCSDCWRNIKEGVIPLGLKRFDDSLIASWQLTSKEDYGIPSATVGKLKRQGILKSRDLKREDGTIYHTVYLVEENKEFLKKYPRKPRPKHFITDLLGNKVER